jgi:hypothetical protein
MCEEVCWSWICQYRSKLTIGTERVRLGDKVTLFPKSIRVTHEVRQRDSTHVMLGEESVVLGAETLMLGSHGCLCMCGE